MAIIATRSEAQRPPPNITLFIVQESDERFACTYFVKTLTYHKFRNQIYGQSLVKAKLYIALWLS